MRRALGAALAIALTVACSDQKTSTPGAQRRLEILAEAFAVRDRDPAAAVELFSQAGAGPTLERARQEAWLGALVKSGADSRSWRTFLDDRPDADLAARAVLSLATALADEGDLTGAVAILTNAPAEARDRADLELLRLGDETAAAAAARRLARHAPLSLRNHSRSIERSVLATFTHDDWIARARSWRASGLGSQGAAELRGRRRSGVEETQRRRELARCELDAGSSTRALNALPARIDAEPEDLVLRAEAYRRQGWGRSPGRNATRSFRSCLDEAESAAGSDDEETRTQALILVLECATESRELDRATAAWRRLESAGWSHPKRSWLGRRLGVALARADAPTEIISGLASALPQHERCFRFWWAFSRSDDHLLADLSSAQIIDLYGTWARRLSGIDPPSRRYVAPNPVRVADPTPAVAWLLHRASPGEASAEWSRLFRKRPPTRSEAMAATLQAHKAGRPNTAVRTLRAGFPEIASIAIADVPYNAAVAYLPLAYEDLISAAARANRLDPWLLAAVARQESTFHPGARSPAGAEGVLQLLPSTARLHSRALGLGNHPNLTDPAINIPIGARELAALVERYGAVEPALAAYNAGHQRVRRWWREWPDPAVFSESIPIPETYNYVRRVIFLADAYRQIHADAWKESP